LVGELESKLILRKERLKSLNPDTHQFKKALVPRLQVINNSTADHMSKAFDRIRPDVGDSSNNNNRERLRKEERVKDRKVRVAMSDFEEALERQRFLKYDLIWQRAEDAFVQKKKSAIE